MLTIDAADPTPIYAQLERSIRAAIAIGRLQAGDRLPTVRQLASDLQINANTVARVYAELERAGVVTTRRGVGTSIRENATPSVLAAATPRDHERKLRALVDRLIADASAVGIPFQEVAAYIKGLEARSTRVNA